MQEIVPGVTDLELKNDVNRGVPRGPSVSRSGTVQDPRIFYEQLTCKESRFPS